MTSTDTIQKFVEGLEPNKIKVPDVRTVIIPEDLYIDFEGGIKKALVNFEEQPLYQGHNRDTLALTLMCLYKKDLYRLGFANNPHEADLKVNMKKLNYEIIRDNRFVGIHQSHKCRASIHFLNPLRMGKCILN